MKKLIPAAMIALILAACATLNIQRRPEATVEKFDVESITLRDVTLLVDVGVDNPYPIGLKLDDVILKFFVEGKQLFKSDTKKGLRIKAGAKEVSTFRVNLKYEDIMNIVKDYTKKEYLTCVADITIVIPLPKIPGIMEDNLPFKYKREMKIPAIKPSINIANFRVQMPTMADVEKALENARKKAVDSGQVFKMFGDILSGKQPAKIISPDELDLPLKVDFDIVLRNNTEAKLLFQDVGYDFYVNSSRLVQGNTDKIVTEGKTTILKISNTFSTRALGASILDSFRKKTGNYTLKGQTMIKLPAAVKKEPLKLIFDENGTFGL